MTHQDQVLYLFLLLAADRHGVSFYRKEKICDAAGLEWGPFEVARDRLIKLKLVAFEPYSAFTPNGFYQVLPVDGRPLDFAGEVVKPVAWAPSSPDRSERARQTRSDSAGDAVAWARA